MPLQPQPQQLVSIVVAVVLAYFAADSHRLGYILKLLPTCIGLEQGALEHRQLTFLAPATLFVVFVMSSNYLFRLFSPLVAELADDPAIDRNWWCAGLLIPADSRLAVCLSAASIIGAW